MDISALPESVPIFPLQGVVLLPGCRLPLNIFEPRYLNMTRDAIAGDKLVAMVQPTEPERIDPTDRPSVYGTGCVGKITAFAEAQNDRILMTLTGVCRFDIVEELPMVRGYRRVRADYSSYRVDLLGDRTACVDRGRLLATLRGYFDMQSLSTDWQAIEDTPDGTLVNSLTMLCPFESSEKQALLECMDIETRCDTMIALLEMAALRPDNGETQRTH